MNGYRNAWMNGTRVMEDGEERVGSFSAGIEHISATKHGDGVCNVYSIVIGDANGCSNFEESIAAYFNVELSDIRKLSDRVFLVEEIRNPPF